MKDQLKESVLSADELQKAASALEKYGFKATVSGEFIKGKKRVLITPTGFNWQDGLYKEFDLTLNEVLSYLKK